MTLEQARLKLLSLIEPGRRKRAEQVKIINPRITSGRLTGTAKGSGGKRYDVWADLASLETGCECWDHNKQTCKHVGALLMTWEWPEEEQRIAA